jgi:ATP-dependent DNA helicase RecG
MQGLIDGAEAFLSKHLAVGAVIEEWTRTDVPEYPIEALREALTNAVVHRNYAQEGQSVRIFLYRDRVEFHSPGLLLPGITVEMMQRGEVPSKLRNPVLANLLRDLPGYFERLGLGVRLMLAETARRNMPPPEFREQSGEFQVIFRKVPLAISSALPARRLAVRAHDLEPAGAAPMEVEERLRRAIQYVNAHGIITNQAYRALTGVSEKTAQRDLERLVERGALTFTGERRARRYHLPKRST